MTAADYPPLSPGPGSAGAKGARRRRRAMAHPRSPRGGADQAAVQGLSPAGGRRPGDSGGAGGGDFGRAHGGAGSVQVVEIRQLIGSWARPTRDFFKPHPLRGFGACDRVLIISHGKMVALARRGAVRDAIGVEGAGADDQGSAEASGGRWGRPGWEKWR
jgi:hypothetical protein